MKPQELSLMLTQWAHANAPTYGLTVESVDVAILGVADSEMFSESGERGGVFPILIATLTVRKPSTLFRDITLPAVRHLISQFECLYFQTCHDIWMAKDLAVRGRIVVV